VASWPCFSWDYYRSFIIIDRGFKFLPGQFRGFRKELTPEKSSLGGKLYQSGSAGPKGVTFRALGGCFFMPKAQKFMNGLQKVFLVLVLPFGLLSSILFYPSFNSAKLILANSVVSSANPLLSLQQWKHPELTQALEPLEGAELAFGASSEILIDRPMTGIEERYAG
jgi:hypothetical protein